METTGRPQSGSPVGGGSRRTRRHSARCAVSLVLIALLSFAGVCIAAPAQVHASDLAFTDISGHPYADFITEMANQGVINGYKDGTFRPDNPVLRKHFAKMIVGVMGLSVSEADWSDANPPFLDCGQDDPNDVYPHDFIAVAKANGLTRGKTATTFAPEANITRAQLITMVIRAADAAGAFLVAVGDDYDGIFRNYSDPTHGQNVKLAEHNGLLEGLLVDAEPSAWLAGNATRGEVALMLVRWSLALPVIIGPPVPL